MLPGPIRSSTASDSTEYGRSSPVTQLFFILLVVFVIFSIAYISRRFAGKWFVDDALSLTRASQEILDQGTISPTAYAYPFGFGYQSLNVFLAHLSGQSIKTLQDYIQPFLVILLVPVAYVTFLRLTRKQMVAMLAALLLFLQPDFIFETVRSSHAKLTWILALTMLYILARSFESMNDGRRPTLWILLFYLITLALIATNSFFASSYILGITFAFIGLQLLRRLPLTRGISFPSGFRRLLYITLSGTVLVFIFIFYLYPSAQLPLFTLRSTVGRLAALLLGLERFGPSPYSYVTSTWLTTPTYMALTSLNYLVLIISLVAWLRLAYITIVKRQQLAASYYLLWLLYPSLAVILALSIVLDFSGVLSQNLQVRLFPHLMVVAIPIAALLIVEMLGGLRNRHRRLFAVAPFVLVVMVVFSAAAGLLKVTNDPLLSNHWLYYTRSEQLAVEWAEGTLAETAVWTGPDRRLAIYIIFNSEWLNEKVEPLPGRHTQENRHVLLSDTVRANAARVDAVLPDVRPQNLVYDGGDAQFYYRRPVTPYQR